MQTPFFPTLRSRLAALGRRTVHTLRHTSLPQLEQCLESYLPVQLLSAEDEGTNSRQRIYSLRLTFQCFIWQMLKPQTACREVVRQVQALFLLKGLGRVKQGASAYCQARLRLPRERLEKALAHLSQQANQKVGPGGCLRGRVVKVVDGTTVQLADKRKVDFRKAKRLGSNDSLFVWTKGKLCPPYLTSTQWADIAAVMTVRIVRFRVANGRSRTRSMTLVTTLLDPKLYPLEELAILYARRWRMELCFRDLKTQMGMEQLRCQTPDMTEKEALAYLVAHNLIRCVMAQAIASYEVELERLSFKGTVDSLRQFTNTMAQARNRRKNSGNYGGI